jgi:ubiquinone/menaquinone biosynthesis C-methylase UbiE
LEIKDIDNQRKNVVKGHFSRRSEYWDSLYNDSDGKQTFTKFELRRRKEIVFNFIEKINSEKINRVLDLGCGAGQYLAQLYSMDFECFGVDISEEMLKITRQKFISHKINNVTLLNSDCYKLPLEDNYFDLIISIGVLEYLDNEKRALLEMKRIIKSGSFIIVTFPNFYKLKNLLDPYYFIIRIWTYLFGKKSAKSFQNNNSKNAKIDFGKSTVNRYSLSNVKKIILNSGFSIIEVKGYCFGPFSIWQKSLFSMETSIKLSNFIEDLSNYKLFGFLKFFANRWVLLIKPEKSG